MRTKKIPQKPVLIIAEVAQAHEGSFSLARSYIKKISQSGADAVKFQTHIADAESTAAEPFRIPPKTDRYRNRYDYWKKTEFTFRQWKLLCRYARSRGLLFLSSPFSVEAVDLLEKIGVSAWKIASGEVTTVPLLKRIIQTGKPVIVSTGMSTCREIDGLVKLFKRKNIKYTLLQATSIYPCPFNKIGLNVMLDLKEKYRCPVGLSDHSGSIFPSIAAAALGASILEAHIVLDKDRGSFDAGSSVTIQELGQLVKGVRAIETMLANPVNKDNIALELESMKRIFGKSVVAGKHLPSGTIIDEGDIAFKKPGTGIPGGDAGRVIGRKLRKSVYKDQLISMRDLA